MPAEGFAIYGLAALHGLALILTVGMLMSRGRFRRVPEFWALVVYWIPAITLFAALMGLRSDRPPPPDEFFRACRTAILGTSVAFPVIVGLRLAMHSWRSRATSRTL